MGIIAAAACLVAAGAGIADTTNTDPTGDAKGGSPDITRVVTSNDAAGLITFRITTVAPIIDSSIIGIDLDTDSNPGTGGGGFEYSLIAGTGGFGILKWNGTAFADATARSLTMTRSGNVVEFKINRADIGNVDRFGFDVFTVNFDAADDFLGEDDAPDGGAYVYTLALHAVRERQGRRRRRQDRRHATSAARRRPTTSRGTTGDAEGGQGPTVPAKPKAGKAGRRRSRRDPGGDRRRHHVGNRQCVARVGTEALPANGKVRSGRRGLHVHAAGDVEGQDRARHDHRHRSRATRSRSRSRSR